jgi:hAT family C-terminal dimerisation region/BED zinc finger
MPEDTTQPVSQPASRTAISPRSGIWSHFKKSDDYANTRKVTCVHCGKMYISANGSTGNMWSHMKSVHSGILGILAIIGPEESSEIVPYNEGMSKTLLVEWFTRECMPFTVVESPCFRKFVRMLKPETVIPSADTIKRETISMFDTEKNRVRAMLQGAPGKLSFAVDAWTAANMKPFLGVTVHWIDCEWHLHNVMLDFALLSGPHSGENLCAVFKSACTDFGVLDKLLAITTDNASNNDAFLAQLEDDCHLHGINFSKDENHVRCVAHVLNIAVQALLETLQSDALDSEDDFLAASDARAGLSHCIPRLRRLVVKIRSSPQRREMFARQCGFSGVPVKGLVADVKTRWNSTFAMIERALEMREPLDNTVDADRELRKYQLAGDEWTLLATVCKLFECFKQATDDLCSSSYPTIASAVGVYNFLMDKIEDFRDGHPESMTIRDAVGAAMAKLKPYYLRCDASVYPVSTILDPRLKIEFYRAHSWEPKYINEAKTCMERVYRSYCVQATPSEPASDGNSKDPPTNPVRAYMYKRPRIAKENELEGYLAAPVVDGDTDVLQWWKSNALLYPHLAEMARDYLAIPATCASVERAFSGGADVVQQKRCTLNGDTIRACMCLKSWLE